MKKFLYLLILSWIHFQSFSQANTGTASAVTTFNSIGLYWSGSGGSSSTACTVKYKESRSSVWSDGYNLSFDTRAIGGRPANEYRGSIVYVKSNTSYDILLSAGSASYSLTATTWNENFPTGATTSTLSGSITSGGTASAYKVYTGTYSGDVTVNAPYIVFKNCVFKGATNDAIVLGANAHDVVFDHCEVTGWGQPASVLGGNNQAAFRTKFTSSTTRIIIQYCKIHNPRYSASGWSTETAGDHPYGVNGINFEGSGGNHVIRYNDIYSDSLNPMTFRFMDGIGGADNFTTTGFPGANSDIYGNTITGCFDDGIEAEGGGCNIRIWNNFLNYTFTGIATATVAIGPAYVFNNVTNVGSRMPYTSSTEDRGPFNKCGGNGDASVTGGRCYLFHNTVLQPSGNRGLCGGIVDNGGKVTNVVSINNIWTSAYTNVGGLPIGLWVSGSSATSTNDLIYPNSTNGSVTKTGSITSAPLYQNAVSTSYNPAGYFLATNSPGKGKALVLYNFNPVAGSDIGAYNAGNLSFGSSTGSVIVTPTNKLPVVSAGSNVSLTLPSNSTVLNGSATDPDGTIVSYSWSKTSGPSQFILGNQTTSVTSLSNLVQGTYVFTLTAVDNSGGSSSSNVTVVVNAAPNQAPIVSINSGKDTTTNQASVVLSALASDADGTISSYVWTQLSGTQAVLTPNNSSITVSGLSAGIYTFRLTVMDNSGASAFDDITVTVSAVTATKTAVKIIIQYSDGSSTTINL